ncbi:tramtrack [Microdochium nivale]|nr:tramtrack [Microdochium nivale]
MVQPRYPTPTGSQISGKPACERLPAIVDNCAHSRLLLMVMEYYFMSGTDVGAGCECPMMRCPMEFNNARDMIEHLKTCDCLDQEEMWCPCGCRQWFRFSAANKKECAWSYTKPSIPQRIGDYAQRLTRIKSKSKTKERSTDTSTTGSDVSTLGISDDEFSVGDCSPHDAGSDDQVLGIPWHNDNKKWQPDLPKGLPSHIAAPNIGSTFSELTELGIVEMDNSVIPLRELSGTTLDGKNQELNHPAKPSKSMNAHGYQQHPHVTPSQLQSIDQYQVSVPSAASSLCHPTADPFVTEKSAEGDSTFEELGFRRSSSPAPMDAVYTPNQHSQIHHDELWWIPELENTATHGAGFSPLSPDFSPMNEVVELSGQSQAASTLFPVKLVGTDRYWPQQNLPTPPQTRTNSGDDNFAPTLDWQPNPTETIDGDLSVLSPTLMTSRPHLTSSGTSQLADIPSQRSVLQPWLITTSEQNNLPPDYYSHATGSALQTRTEVHKTHSSDSPASALAVLRCPKSDHPIHCRYSVAYDPNRDGSKKKAIDNRRRHVERKHTGRSWVCMICSKTCTRLDNMQKHYRVAHPGGRMRQKEKVNGVTEMEI